MDLCCIARYTFVILAACVAVSAAAAPAPAADSADFAGVVRPFLEAHCTRCHSDDKPKADLSLKAIGWAPSAGTHADDWKRVDVSGWRNVAFLGSHPVDEEAKADYFDSWRTRWFVKAVNVIPVRRTGGSASEAAIRTGVEALEKGMVVGIYPEGTRSPDQRLYRGKTGVARMAAWVRWVGSRRTQDFAQVEIPRGLPAGGAGRRPGRGAGAGSDRR